MKEFLFAVVLSFALMLGVAFVAAYVPGARYVFAFCGVCSLAFVTLAYYERRKYAKAAKPVTYAQWDQIQGRLRRYGQRAPARDTVRE